MSGAAEIAPNGKVMGETFGFEKIHALNLPSMIVGFPLPSSFLAADFREFTLPRFRKRVTAIIGFCLLGLYDDFAPSGK
jgi:hypothetical protein